jgi:hypothetical protein
MTVSRSDSDYIWYCPKNRNEIKSFPAGTTAVNLRHYENLSDDDLYDLHESLEKVYIACCSNITHLRGLHHLKNLKHLDIDVCNSITQESLVEIKRMLPNAIVSTWGCWQLAGTCPEVQRQSDDLFTNVLGVVPPRLWDQIIACEE